jgi:hypothetical protein
MIVIMIVIIMIVIDTKLDEIIQDNLGSAIVPERSPEDGEQGANLGLQHQSLDSLCLRKALNEIHQLHDQTVII